MPERAKEQFQTSVATPRARQAAEQVAAAKTDLANMTETDIETAIGQMTAEGLERHEVIDPEHQRLKRTIDETRAYQRIQESVRLLRETDAQETGQAVSALRERLFGSSAELQQPTSRRERVAITGEALENIQTLARVAETQRAGLGREVLTRGGAVEGPTKIETPFESAATFRGVTKPEQSSERTAMFSLADLAAQEKKKNLTPVPPTRPAA